jgi:hypothetical protein
MFRYDTGVISAALVSIRDDLGHTLSHTEKEWISSATSCGALIGYVQVDVKTGATTKAIDVPF